MTWAWGVSKQGSSESSERQAAPQFASLLGRDRHGFIYSDAFWRFGVRPGINSNDFEGGIRGLGRVGVVRASRNADAAAGSEFVKRDVFSIGGKILPLCIGQSKQVIAYGRDI